MSEPDARGGAPAREPIRVDVAGLLRGRDLSGPATLAAEREALVLVTQRVRVRIPVSALEGVRCAGGRAEIYVDTGDVIQVSGGGAVETLVAQLTRQVCTLPELTRSLRALGSRHGGPDAEHDGFFAPLLDARRAAEHAADAVARRAAFDAPVLRAALVRRLHDIAVARYPDDPPERRALEAELLDETEPLLAALDGLAGAARALDVAGDGERYVAWRAWAAVLRTTYERADECWLALRRVLSAERRGQPPHRWRRWRRWLGRGAIVLTLTAPGAAHAQHVTLRVTGVTADTLRAHGFDVVDTRGGVVLVVADARERTRLAALGWSATPLSARPPVAPLARGGRAPAVFRPFDDPARGVAFVLDSLARANPRVHLDTIGRSVEGRPLIAAKVGAVDDDPGRPNAFVVGTYHAREWIATEVVLRLLERLAQPPGLDPRIDSLVARRDIWVLPVANPDGYQYTFTADRLWRKNRRPNADGSFGVDLNRNHGYEWGFDDAGSSAIPSSETYRGPAPESEPEVRAIEQFHRAHPPVVSISYHSYGDLALYPWAYDYGRIPGDRGIYRALTGTDLRPAIRDRLPGAPQDHYHPGMGWNLYTSNGEYTDWAYATIGTLAFTVELTTGIESGVYYGFIFPDDETRVESVFEDNLPFALDVLDAAADPLHVASRTTGLANERIGLESLSPLVRLRLPVPALAAAEVQAGGTLAVQRDTASHGRYTDALVSPRIQRPSGVRVTAADVMQDFTLLGATGAESGETGWTASGFGVVNAPFAGDRAWAAATGSLRSPPIAVPADVDSISVLYWTRYNGNADDLALHGEVRASTDGGTTWMPIGFVAGVAPSYYPERADIAGVAGKTLRIELRAAFSSGPPQWWVDEVTIVAHGDSRGVGSNTVALRPSENPVRGDSVAFVWPFGGREGDVRVFDFVGRLVWRVHVLGSTAAVWWPIARGGARNGVYVAVASAGHDVARFKLIVVRGHARAEE